MIDPCHKTEVIPFEIENLQAFMHYSATTINSYTLKDTVSTRLYAKDFCGQPEW
jgi:hypothetical protein